MGKKQKHNARPWYWGKLDAANMHGSVREIWFTRNDELPELPTCEPAEDYSASIEAYERRELALKLLEHTALRWRERYVVARCVMGDASFAEVGAEFGVSKERIRQLAHKALRKLKRTVYREKHELL